MAGYLETVILLNFAVDLLLLAGSSRLSGFPVGWGTAILGAALGGIYAGCCMLPGFQFLGNFLWRCVSLGLMGTIAFGMSLSGLRRSLVFSLLSMALGGIALCMGTGGVTGLVAGGAVLLVCCLGFRFPPGSREYVPVELPHGDKCQRLLALRDTGNMLRDPITGQAVLVVDADAGETLLGLTPRQLCDPVAAVASAGVPGLRLLPYRSLGSPKGMLAAIRLENTKIGDFQGSALVAFAPQKLDSEGIYRGLTGGIV
jgi:hypothetical protein